MVQKEEMSSASSSSEQNKTLCLNMIVRNEGKRMIRLLDSDVKKIIDEVVISDTGSTDDTIQIIKDKCLELKIPCHIDQTPFKDFGFNRSRGIQVAVEKSTCDYILFMDADMKLVVTPRFSKQEILKRDMDIYSLMQKNGGLEYYNVRIAKRTLAGLKCVGVTHEHYAADKQMSNMNIPPEFIFIDDIGDGGCKSDKFPRDYRLLTQGLVDEPDNVRYMFYLAETCRHDRKFDESIKWYKKRVKAGGWDEEVFRALLGITLCHYEMKNAAKGDKYAMMAYLHRPTRVESLYAACKWHREKGENLKAYIFYQLGHRIARPPNDVLFVEAAPYQWGWKLEYSILAYYVEKHNSTIFKNPTSLSMCLRTIISSLGCCAAKDSEIPGFAFDNILENCKHYIELVPSIFQRKDMNGCILQGFTSSTPGVIRLRGQNSLTRHIRHVDYKIRRENGSYILRDDGCVGTLYTFKQNDESEWRKLKVDCTGVTEGPPRYVKDIEDIRFFNMESGGGFLPSTMSDDTVTFRKTTIEETDNRVYGIGTTAQYSKDGNLTMVLVEVDMKNAIAFPIKRIPRVFSCEKNHSPISGTNLCVHSWGPELKIYDMVKTTEDQISWAHQFPASEVPAMFCDLRGSSCGVQFPSTGTPVEYWFVCHKVFHETPRRYVHCIVRLDAKTFRPTGFTIPFNFDEYKIEFVGGIGFEDNDQTLVVGYSVFDSSSREVRIPVVWIMRDMMLNIMISSRAG